MLDIDVSPGGRCCCRRAVARGLAVLALFAAAAVVLTWPVARHLGAAYPTFGFDPVLNNWAMVREARALLRFDFAGIFSGNIFYPYSRTVLFTENLVGWQWAFLPAYAASGNPILAYNVVFLLSYVTTAFATYLLVRGLTGSTSGGVVAGLAFAFGPFRQNHMNHVQLLGAGWTPAALLCLHRFFERRRLRWAAAAGAAAALQLLTCLYLGVFLGLALGAFVAFSLVTVGRGAAGSRRAVFSGRVWAGLALAGAVAAVGAGWLFPLYRAAARRVRIVRPIDEMARFAARPIDYLRPQAKAAFWFALGLTERPDEQGQEWPTAAALLLALVGTAAALHPRTRQRTGMIQASRKKGSGTLTAGSPTPFSGRVQDQRENGVGDLGGSGPRPHSPSGPEPSRKPSPSNIQPPPSHAEPSDRRHPSTQHPTPDTRAQSAIRHPPSAIWFYVLLIPVMAMLSLGPGLRLSEGRFLGRGPFDLLVRCVPGFQGIRAPGRLSMFVALGVAVLAGHGVAALVRAVRGPGRRAALLALVALLLAVDIVPRPVAVNFFAPDDETRALCRWIQDLPATAVLADLPCPPGVDYYWRDSRYLRQAMHHDRRTINGGSREPRGYVLAADALSRFPDPDALLTLQGIGVTHLVVHTGRRWGWSVTERDLAGLPLRIVGRFGEAVACEVPPLGAPEVIPPPMVASPAPPGATLYVAIQVPWSRVMSFGLAPGPWTVTWTPSPFQGEGGVRVAGRDSQPRHLVGGEKGRTATVYPFTERSGPIYLAAPIAVPETPGQYALRIEDGRGRFDHTVPVVVSPAARIEALAASPRARITANVPASVPAGAEPYIRVRLENIGTTIWPCKAAQDSPAPADVRYDRPSNGGEPAGAAPAYRNRGRPDHEVRLMWFMLDPEGQVGRRTVDSGRRLLRGDLAPGQAVELGFILRAPTRPGRYVLTIDPIVEHHARFADLGSEPLVTTVTVTP